MRIIAGSYRGKKLLSPRSPSIRPTSDQAREAVFNILNAKLDRPWNQLSLADIFAGSGAFALEAISRGASSATLVDIDLTDAARNVALFPSEKNKIRLLKADATKLPVPSTPFDLIFLDAPYRQELSEKALDVLLRQKWLTSNALCVIELARDEAFALPQGFELIDERCYGITRFLFLIRHAA